MSYNKLAIGICTYKRPLLLRQCLQSIFSMNMPDELEICIIVTDNDPTGSAKSIVEEFNTINQIPIHYYVEKKKGIVFARNNILSAAKNHKVTELAFIDDDEFVDINWLMILWNYYSSNDVDVVWGWVKVIYPSNTPKWIVDGNFFQLPKNISGQQYFTAYTGNVLFNFKKIVKEGGIYFNEDYAFFGEDEDFFMQAANQGAVIHYLAEAVIYETLEDSRMSMNYYLKRLFYVKNNQKVFKDQSFMFKLKILKSGLVDIARSIFLFTMGLLTWKKYKFILSIGFMVSASAKITGFFGIYYNHIN